MSTPQAAAQNIDEYIAAFPSEVQVILEKIRITIKNAAPGAEESISYKIPTFRLGGRLLIYFAAYRKHICLYPAPIRDPDFKEDLSAYESGQSTVKFPLDKPIPFDLIGKIVKFRAKAS